MKRLLFLFLILAGCAGEPEVMSTETKPLIIENREVKPILPMSFQCPIDASWQYFQAWDLGGSNNIPYGTPETMTLTTYDYLYVKPYSERFKFKNMSSNTVNFYCNGSFVTMLYPGMSQDIYLNDTGCATGPIYRTFTYSITLVYGSGTTQINMYPSVNTSHTTNNGGIGYLPFVWQ